MKHRYKTFYIVLIPMLVTLTGCNSLQIANSEPPAFQNSDHLIVPGQRIGPVMLNMSDRDLFRLGVPDRTQPFGQNRMFYNYNNGFVIIVDLTSHQVISFTLQDNSSYHTAQGLGVGSSLQQVEAGMGPPSYIMGNPFFGYSPENVKYGPDFEFSFGKTGGSMADSPMNTVQSVSMQVPGSGCM